MNLTGFVSELLLGYVRTQESLVQSYTRIRYLRQIQLCTNSVETELSQNLQIKINDSRTKPKVQEDKIVPQWFTLPKRSLTL